MVKPERSVGQRTTTVIRVANKYSQQQQNNKQCGQLQAAFVARDGLRFKRT